MTRLIYEHTVTVEECLNMMTIRAHDLGHLVQQVVKIVDESHHEQVFRAADQLLKAIETLKAIKFGRA